MRSKLSVRNFIAATILGTVAALVFSQVQDLHEQTGAFEQGLPENLNKNTLAQSDLWSMPKRAMPSEFLIFPFCEMPEYVENGRWGDFDSIGEMMSDLYKCGFNVTPFIDVRHLKHARNNKLMGMLSKNIHIENKITPEEAKNYVEELLGGIVDTSDRKAVYAIFTCDTPNVSNFANLKIWSDAIKAQGIVPYINLFSEEVDVDKTKAGTHGNYLNTFISTLKNRHTFLTIIIRSERAGYLKAAGFTVT